MHCFDDLRMCSQCHNVQQLCPMLDHIQELMFMEAEYVIISYLTNQPKVTTAPFRISLLMNVCAYSIRDRFFPLGFI